MPLWHFNSPYWRMRIQNALLFIHVTYIVYYIHGFTQISSEACRLRLNINYWLIKNNIRITPSNLRENERGRWRDIKWLNQRGWAGNPVKTKIAVQAGVYKFLLPFICFSYGVYLSVLAQRGYSWFQVTGMIKWGQKSKSKTIPWASNKTQQIVGPKFIP